MTTQKNFLRRVGSRYSVDRSTMSNTEWICENTSLRGRPFSTKSYEFQKAILDDNHPNLSCRKISQVGLSECQIRKTICFINRHQGVSAIFTLPTETMFKRMSKSRIKPIVENTPALNTERDQGASRSMDVMQFGHSWLFVTACLEGDATSIAADIVMNDEVDLSPQDILALFNSRLQNSNYRINQRFSTPTFPSYGIDQDWNISDQHHYLIRCSSCNKWNNPEFTREFVHIPGLPEQVQNLTELDSSMVDVIELNNSYVKCKHCDSPLDLGNSDLRDWVPTTRAGLIIEVIRFRHFRRIDWGLIISFSNFSITNKGIT